MKKFYFLVLCLCSTNVFATTPYGTAVRSGGSAGYLVDAANAWASVAPGAGKTAIVTAKMTSVYSTSTKEFRDLMSVLAYNESAITIFEITQHASNAFSFISDPLDSRRTRKSELMITGGFLGGMSNFESKYNGDFDTTRKTFIAGGQTYVTDGLMLGLGVARSMTDTNDARIYNKANTNSLTLFGQYLSRENIFVNAGAVIGRTNWTTDKNLSGINDSAFYDSNLYAGQLNGGVVFNQGVISIVPKAGLNYIFIQTEQHIDSAVQNFDAWSNGSLSGNASVTFSNQIKLSGMTFGPSVGIGTAYKTVSNGDKTIKATLINASSYYMPVENPDNVSYFLNANVGLSGDTFSVGIRYELDIQGNFTAHTAGINLNMKF